ncbi:hypothetical protein CALVIDRAFT_347995 [Calocera viscosa TUFC12733]|uniref:Uncharacterized protein n=1 Tax=Calocera viscosa (strain TUFC12733) TaxID=1330018 RepID=A0A167H8Q7_CALVF|nr:hypothetical protein CALVIDRAFT_347995 [Calocera viscosa TUFC12733]
MALRETARSWMSPLRMVWSCVGWISNRKCPSSPAPRSRATETSRLPLRRCREIATAGSRRAVADRAGRAAGVAGAVGAAGAGSHKSHLL